MEPEPKEAWKQDFYLVTVTANVGCVSDTAQFVISVVSPCAQDTLTLDDSVFPDLSWTLTDEPYIYGWDSMIVDNSGIDCQFI